MSSTEISPGAACDPLRQGAFPANKCREQLPLRRFVEQLRKCGSVRQCFLLWHFVAVHVALQAQTTHRFLPQFRIPAERLREVLQELEEEAAGRAAHWEQADVWSAALKTVIEGIDIDIADIGINSRSTYAASLLGDHSTSVREFVGSSSKITAALGVPRATHSALLVHFAAATPEVAREVQPFVDLLYCFAKRQGLEFLYDALPHLHFSWLGKANVGLLQDNYGAITFQTAPKSTSAFHHNMSAHLKTWLNIAGGDPGHGEEILRQVSHAHVWREIEEKLHVINGNPVRWAKVWALQAALARGFEAVVYFDYDMTVRPDCLGASRLLEAAFTPGHLGTMPHIVVRDSPVGVDCLNSGFVAFRNSAVSKDFLRVWQEKVRWPGVLHGDQGALAETLLEFLDLEYRSVKGFYMSGGDIRNVEGYNHRCMAFLFPSSIGLHSWRNYCDCFNYYLQYLAGPFTLRRSTLIRFLNPREMDVNFLPNSLTPDHMYDLRRMRLLPPRRRKHQVGKRHQNMSSTVTPRVLTPLVVHWAGIENRTHLMRSYLVRRFGLSPGWFTQGRGAADRCFALSSLSPRSNPMCMKRGMGTTIENIFQGWDFEHRADFIRTPRSEDSAREVFKNILAHDLAEKPGGAPLPDRQDDLWTTSKRFRNDLVQFIGGLETARRMAVVEIGGYVGYTTRFLAEHFRAVVSVDCKAPYVAMAKQLLSSYQNAEALEMNTIQDEWTPLVDRARALGGASLVVIDGDHAYETVVNDLELAISAGIGPAHRHKRPRFVALDDYFVRAEVAQAVADFVDLGLLRTVAILGENEGMLCEVLT